MATKEQKNHSRCSEGQEEDPMSSKQPNATVPRINEEYHFTQVSEEIKCRLAKKLSQEFSSTESQFLGALFNLNEFLWNPQVRAQSKIGPGTS